MLDGELLIESNGRGSFDDLLMRIHPAASRIRKLATETPATYLVFDLLVDGKGIALVKLTPDKRRQKLEQFFMRAAVPKSIQLSPATRRYAQAKRRRTELQPAGSTA